MNSIEQASKIIAFRDFLRARFPEAHEVAPDREQAHVMSGAFELGPLDLRKGAITEVVAPSAGCGAGLLLAELLQHDRTCRELIALIDGSDAFDPWSICPEALEHVLWVRCKEPAMAIKAADLLLRDGNMPLVILDLQSHAPKALQRFPSSVWHRLRMLAEKSGSCLCAFTPVRTVSCARTRVRMTGGFQLSHLYQDRAVLLSELSFQIDRQQTKVLTPEPVRVTA